MDHPQSHSPEQGTYCALSIPYPYFSPATGHLLRWTVLPHGQDLNTWEQRRFLRKVLTVLTSSHESCSHSVIPKPSKALTPNV